MRRCPICQSDLKKKSYKGVGVDECPHTHGVFFDRGELTRAKDAIDPDLSFLDFDLFDTPVEGQMASKKQCPKDDEQMVTVRYGNSQIKVDLCPTCNGVWLDTDELEKILSYLERFVHHQSVEDLTKMTQEEFSEIFTGDKLMSEELKDFVAVSNLLGERYAAEHPTLSKWIEVYYKYTPFR